MAKPIHDQGRPFDWGRSTEDYAAYRDIYPVSFFETILRSGIGRAGQRILDLGTGTGVVPRGMAGFGASWTGLDASRDQIEAARQRTTDMPNIDWSIGTAEETGLPNRAFDAVTAVQCWHYFDINRAIPEICRLLIPGGRLMIGHMNWLPLEDEIAAKTEALVLARNPAWSGAGWRFDRSRKPNWAAVGFQLQDTIAYKEAIPFSAESWRGRIRACRGVGPSLNAEETVAFDRDLAALLDNEFGQEFSVLHQIYFYVFRSTEN